jgi:hypothetical protein
MQVKAIYKVKGTSWVIRTLSGATCLAQFLILSPENYKQVNAETITKARAKEIAGYLPE